MSSSPGVMRTLVGLLALILLIHPATAAVAGPLDCTQLLKTAKYKKQPFTGCQVLSPRKAVAMWFANDDANGRNGDIVIRYIIREADPQLRGWMGLGFSDMGAMTGGSGVPCSFDSCQLPEAAKLENYSCCSLYGQCYACYWRINTKPTG